MGRSSSTRTLSLGPSPRLRPHRAPVHPELTRNRVHAEPLHAGCSDSVHFLVREACSRSFLWFRRGVVIKSAGIEKVPALLRSFSSVCLALRGRESSEERRVGK